MTFGELYENRAAECVEGALPRMRIVSADEYFEGTRGDTLAVLGARTVRSE